MLCVLTTVYFLYICWDWLRAGQEPETRLEQRRRRGVTVLWALILLVILGVYGVLGLSGLLCRPVEWAFIIMAHMVNFSYRWHKGNLYLGWLLDALIFWQKHKEVC